MTTQEDHAPPALFGHCVNVYNAMLKEAGSVNNGTKTNGSDENTEELQVIVYEGFLTQLITGKLNLSVPYYSSVTQALIRMGCIRQLRRGGSTSKSQWEMVYEPTVEAFYRTEPSKIKAQTKDDQTNELITGLNNRVRELEDWQTEINIMLVNKFGVEE